MAGSVPLTSIGGHLVHVPVRVGGTVTTRFVVDTGIGFDLVSESLLTRAGGTRTGETHSARRMSGQSLIVPLARIPSIPVGLLRRDDVRVGVFDLRLPPEMAAIEGFLAPTFFADVPFTIGRSAGSLAWGDGGEPPPRRVGGVSVPLEVRWDGPAVSLFVELELPDGSPVTVEVDTGSDHLILDARYMESLGVRDGDPGVRRMGGTDESGHDFVRYFAPVRGRVSIRGQAALGQQDPMVQFQKILHDGLLGDEFLRSRDVTFDLPRHRLTFGPPPR